MNIRKLQMQKFCNIGPWCCYFEEKTFFWKTSTTLHIPKHNIQTFYLCNLRKFEKTRVFVPGNPSQPSLMFVGKAKSLC